MTETKKRPSYAGALLAKKLAEQGFRMFKNTDACKIAMDLGYKKGYTREILIHLLKAGWIEKMRHDLYALNDILLGSNPIHEFEIATQMVKESVISHFSAFHYHALTDQIPQTLYATVPTGTPLPRPKKGQGIRVWGIKYCYTQIKKSQFFGHQRVWIGDAKIAVTDVERTLLDGLIKPGHCGGIQEVLKSFQNNINRINVQTLMTYALELDTSIAKRLGWILDNLGIEKNILEPLLLKEFHGYVTLDASGSKSGSYNKKWQIQENI